MLLFGISKLSGIICLLLSCVLVVTTFIKNSEKRYILLIRVFFFNSIHCFLHTQRYNILKNNISCHTILHTLQILELLAGLHSQQCQNRIQDHYIALQNLVQQGEVFVFDVWKYHSSKIIVVQFLEIHPSLRNSYEPKLQISFKGKIIRSTDFTKKKTRHYFSFFTHPFFAFFLYYIPLFS